ncbi:repeating coiled region of VPS13 domain-containing protein [Ditylenchus destructor]|nr:repeating coiled region of VPS13 domain-containing protein [Ditylenchus destructor]
MVFEGILADVLNRFLGDFVENLDPSKLSVGIWGGDVKLDGLRVKDTAMDFLDLPVKLKYGSLDKLVLKIPWKNLYTEPVLANIEGLNLIIVPNRGVVYNEEKAKKNEYETKQKLLARLEENRKAKRKPKDPTADSFTEKLVAQIIKNLQISVKGIHVRYEDRHSNRHRPFAAGITLESLEFQTTDTNFKTTIHKETMKIFYKLVSLKSLAVYWNSDSAFISDSDSADNVKGTLQTTIATETSKPDDFKYLFGPISIDTRLKLNQKPEADGSNWSIPKIDLEIFMTTLSLFVGKAQYQDVLLFLEAQERFSISIRHLKHRPNLIEYRQHFAQWWKYAYTCIVEDIRRKRKNWSWEMMKNHRAMVRKYKDAWLQFRTKKTVGHEEKAIIEEAEENLDLFNLNVARQQAEMEIDRRQLTRTEDQEVQTWGSWAKSWFGGSSAVKDTKKKEGKLSGQELVDQIEKAITPEEKAKLYEAIYYQENIPATDYPKHYVENRVNVKLSSVSIAVDSALLLKFEELSAHFEQRPSASAIHLKTGVKSVSMDGCGQSMLSLLDTSKDWLSMEVITNPLEGGFDHYVGFKVAPVLLKYHAPVVNRVIDVFKPPGDVRLNQLMTAAMARYEEVKARSATGLQYAVEQKAKLKLEIRLEPATVIVSHGGSFDEQKSTLMAELGVLTINTVDDLSKFHCSDAKDEKLRKLYNQAYDKFQMRLSNVQVVFADSYKKCMDARGDNSSPFHILKPMQAELNLCKATIEDVQLPMFRIYGDLPNVGIRISDEQVTKLLDLLVSIPMPVFQDENEELPDYTRPSTNLRHRATIKAIMDVKGMEEEDTKKVPHIIAEESKRINLVYEFTVGEISILLCSRKKEP